MKKGYLPGASTTFHRLPGPSVHLPEHDQVDGWAIFVSNWYTITYIRSLSFGLGRSIQLMLNVPPNALHWTPRLRSVYNSGSFARRPVSANVTRRWFYEHRNYYGNTWPPCFSSRRVLVLEDYAARACFRGHNNGQQPGSDSKVCGHNCVLWFGSVPNRMRGWLTRER
ncbi:MAG: hypothetical protein QOJ40_1010 [Verrucomicrobiota bacterium]